MIFAGAQRTVHVLHNSEQPASVFAILESGSKVVPLIADGLFDLLMLKMTNIYTSKKQTKIESKGPRFEIGDFCVKLGSVTMSQNFKGILVEVRATLYISLEKKRDSPKIRPSAANFFIIRGISSSFSKRYSSSRLAPTWRIVIIFNSEINFSHKFAFKNYFSTQKYKSEHIRAGYYRRFFFLLPFFDLTANEQRSGIWIQRNAISFGFEFLNLAERNEFFIGRWDALAPATSGVPCQSRDERALSIDSSRDPTLHTCKPHTYARL